MGRAGWRDIFRDNKRLSKSALIYFFITQTLTPLIVFVVNFRGKPNKIKCDQVLKSMSTDRGNIRLLIK